jgi:RHS repeat-associated protein
LVSFVTPQGTVHNEYNAASGLKTRMYTDSTTSPTTDVGYTYDQEGRVTVVSANRLDGNGLVSPITANMTYDLNNNLLTTTLSTNQFESRSYDALNRLTNVTTKTSPSGSVLASFTYTLDAAGRRIAVVELFPAQFSYTREVDYSYDAMSRLTKEVVKNDSNNTTLSSIVYTNDLASNRKEKKVLDGSNNTVNDTVDTFDGNDRLTSESYTAGANSSTLSYTYDANGSTLTKTVTGNALPSESDTYTWDSEIRMVSASITVNNVNHVYTYGYDDRGIRVSSKVDSANPTKYLIDRAQAFDQVLEEYAPNGVLAATYIRGMDLLFQDRSATQSYYIKDGLGSTRALANSTANVTDTYTFDAYGNLATSTGSTTNPLLFTGEQLDGGISKYYLRARYYDAAAARFTSRDRFTDGSSRALVENRFAYANGDPVDNADPSGLVTMTEGRLIHAAIEAMYVADPANAGHVIWRQRAIPTSGGGLLPDVMDFSLGEVAEIKPLSPYGLALGPLQLAVYLGALNGFSVTWRNTTYTLPPTPNFAGKPWTGSGWAPGVRVVPVPALPSRIVLTVGNLGGVIYYISLPSPQYNLERALKLADTLAAQLRTYAQVLLETGTEVSEAIANQIGFILRFSVDTTTLTYLGAGSGLLAASLGLAWAVATLNSTLGGVA